MTTINHVIDKIVQQSQLMFQELSHVDKNFTFSSKQSEQKLVLIVEDIIKPDLVIFNNSFIWRGNLKTNKSPYYLGIKSFPPTDENDVVVTTVAQFNLDWTYKKHGGPDYPESTTLRDSVSEGISDLGEIIYILIGNVGQPGIVKEKINDKNFGELVFDPSVDVITLDNKTITANPKITDAELWKLIQEKCSLNNEEMENLHLRYFETAEKIRKNLVTPLVIPNKSSDLENTFLDEILHSLSDEISRYEESLRAWQTNPDDEANYNNILRIAYNFSDDAVRILKLIINISDLKPILLWMTIYSQYLLRRELSKLERQKSDKPEIEHYDQLVKGARNSRFHNMLHIKNTLHVNMEGIYIQAKAMTLFDEYRRNKPVANFEYKDQKLIEILTEFNRAAEKSVSDSFWEQNLAIMKAACNLINDISDSLKLLRLLE